MGLFPGILYVISLEISWLVMALVKGLKEVILIWQNISTKTKKTKK